ncbi:hypothetical protein MUU72_19945 [Streptomyces sp. RS10V-4]|uniref:hypothetical protein n=1 Tax=Streptomyces rhizoryzae TaxID=2932493 RepID=UPI002005CE96|nr:hypothetical protein [Streptomyces rhizoryzae]MCK7625348.1 hypothetical protein [Streptomyces rhizoryzae]
MTDSAAGNPAGNAGAGPGGNAPGGPAGAPEGAAGNQPPQPPVPPPYPPSTVPGQQPGDRPAVVPADADHALEIGRTHFPPVGSPDGPVSLFVHEFDEGYLIHAGWPAPEDPTAPPATPGGSNIVINKANGDVTSVPNFPPESAIEVYRQWYRPGTP